MYVVQLCVLCMLYSCEGKAGLPLGLENLENGKAFSSQGKVREF